MSTKLTNPTDIARETLRQLATRRIPPTPEHYEDLYHEIEGGKVRKPGGSNNPLLDALVLMLKALPKQSPDLQRNIKLIGTAAEHKDWSAVTAPLVAAIESQGGQATLTRPWADLIRDLLTQWDLRSPHFTAARKQESLAKVLLNFGNYPSLLNEKLAALVVSWSEGAGAEAGIEVAGTEGAGEPAVAEVAPAAATASVEPSATPQGNVDWSLWRELLSRTLRVGIAARLRGEPELAEEAESLALAAETVSSEQGLQFLAERLRRFWALLELKNQRDDRVSAGLVNLLMLVTDNLIAVSGDGRWLEGQVAVVRDILAKPMSMTRLYEAEVGFKEVVFQQGQLHHSMTETQAALKKMISLFIDRLGGMADTTSDYHEKIGVYAGRIETSRDVLDLKHVVDELMQDTRVIQLDMARSREELMAARNEAESAEKRIQELEAELRTVSEKVREDQLTGALNRRGFDEAFMTEIARMERTGKPLCLAMLDLDNFKKLNDQRGHQAGDEALRHLVKVVKDTLRPTDVIARYGGEEFVVLMPETVTSEAANTMRRVQRELTRNFFLHNNERVLVTFSAGITRYMQGEHQEAAIERADQAMYEAKKSGKNQVCVAVQPKQVSEAGTGT